MKNNKFIDKLFLIIISIQTILMGILFIIQILRIYYGNSFEFTREICSKYLLQILPVIILWIITIIVNYIYFTIKNKSFKDNSKISNITKLNNLELICPNVDDSNELFKLLKKEKMKRKIFKIVTLVVIIICSLMGFGYLVNVEHFNPDGNLSAQAVEMTIHLMPWVVISFICLILNVIFEEHSAKKSIVLIKEIIRTNGKDVKPYVENKIVKLIYNISRYVILIIAVVFIVNGINQGDANDVLQKAINICTECIGLG